MKIFFAGLIVLVLFELKWLVQEQVFNSELAYNNTVVEKFVHVGKRVIA